MSMKRTYSALFLSLISMPAFADGYICVAPAQQTPWKFSQGVSIDLDPSSNKGSLDNLNASYGGEKQFELNKPFKLVEESDCAEYEYRGKLPPVEFCKTWGKKTSTATISTNEDRSLLHIKIDEVLKYKKKTRMGFSSEPAEIASSQSLNCYEESTYRFFDGQKYSPRLLVIGSAVYKANMIFNFAAEQNPTSKQISLYNLKSGKVAQMSVGDISKLFLDRKAKSIEVNQIDARFDLDKIKNAKCTIANLYGEFVTRTLTVKDHKVFVTSENGDTEELGKIVKGDGDVKIVSLDAAERVHTPISILPDTFSIVGPRVGALYCKPSSSEEASVAKKTQELLSQMRSMGSTKGDLPPVAEKNDKVRSPAVEASAPSSAESRLSHSAQ